MDTDLYSVGAPAAAAAIQSLAAFDDAAARLQLKAPAAPAVPAASSSAIAPAGAVVKERRTVPDDDAAATAATVKMMADYIAAGVADPLCKEWAAAAVRCYSRGNSEPAWLAWSVFWLIKHCVKYVRDEPVLFRMGEKDARDFLTAPAVLVRMAEPQEDCDGFTMLACTLLSILGLKCYIATVKADAKTPARFSHVFALVDINGRLTAFDTSHGEFPGWMIPRAHIFDWQIYDLAGRPVKLDLPAGISARLNGYARKGRGLGFGIDDTGWLDSISSGAGAGSSSGSGINLTSLFESLIGNAAKVATVAVAPNNSVIIPSTGQVFPLGTSAGSYGSYSAGSGLGSYLPYILLGVVGLALFSGMGKGK